MPLPFGKVPALFGRVLEQFAAERIAQLTFR